MSKRKGKAHVVPESGPRVFVSHDPEKGQLASVSVGGKKLRVRLPGVQAPRDLSPDEYGPPPKGDAA